MSEVTNSNVDPTILKVRGDKTFDGNKEQSKEYVKGLASAVLTVIGKHGSAKLKCVGNAALGNAYKAFCIARGDASKKGVDLVNRGFFGTADFDGTEKTAIIMQIESVSNVVKS